MRAFDQISVAMATYNGGKFLREQLDSLINQTTKPMELVVCDDVSTDNTIKILGEFAKIAPFPVHIYINDIRLGYGDNFLKAGDLCKGSFIAFCDQDDVWYPQKLEISVEALLEHDADLCAHDADLCGVSGNVIGYHSAGGVKGGTYNSLGLPPWGVFFGFTCTFRRSLLEIPAVRVVDDRDRRFLSHDGWTYFLANSFGKTVYIARPLANYRQHGANVHARDLTGLQKIRRLIAEYESYLRRYKHLASVRARILDESSTVWPRQYSSSALRAHRYWKNIEILQDKRLGIASETSLIKRCQKVMSLWRQGAYAPSPVGGLGRRALAEDCLGAFARLAFK